MIISGNGTTLTNRSGTITTGGTAQSLFPANLVRQGGLIQNLSASDLWVNDLGAAAATQPSIRVPPGALYEWPLHAVPVTAVSIFGATTGQAFSAREW